MLEQRGRNVRDMASRPEHNHLQGYSPKTMDFVALAPALAYFQLLAIMTNELGFFEMFRFETGPFVYCYDRSVSSCWEVM